MIKAHIRKRLASVPPLSAGQHTSPDEGMCVMEAAAFIAGEPFSDEPACVCPAISGFLLIWNDGLQDEERNGLLRPLIPRIIGTLANEDIEDRRRMMLADWVIRTQVPTWMKLAGLAIQAADIEALDEIAHQEQFALLIPILANAAETVRSHLVAAFRDVSDAGMNARDNAMLAAESAAARGALDAATEAAKWSGRGQVLTTAHYVALESAWAAKVALEPTIIAMQQSALGLVDRMIIGR